MKADLDHLMETRGLDAVLVFAGHDHTPALDYVAGGVKITGGAAVKLRGHAPVLVVNGMETDEAAASGLEVYSFHAMGFEQAREQAAGDAILMQAYLWGGSLGRLGLESGKVGIYGGLEANAAIALVDGLRQCFPQYQFAGEVSPTLFDMAAITKEADELARITSVAERTNAVMRATWDYISTHRADDSETVVRADGSALTIGDIKRFVRGALLERDLEDTAMIFAQGRDAGMPHSRGEEAMPLKLGQSIVFDLFPREIGGGYHHDMTRTWCIGYAPDDVREAYEQVMSAMEIAEETYSISQPAKALQDAVLDYFEGLGHPTARSTPGTQEGYVHSLGHGLGLKVHESPRISHMAPDDRFEVANVITIEPGLYYPERGYGIRVEDTYIINPRGELVSISDAPKDLILPLRG
jgi:Xaa-Pro aminopeptidase